MTERRAVGWTVQGIESEAKYHIAEDNFTLMAKADLIEKNIHKYAATDYKTGAPSSVSVVKAGFDPQLPLTAFLLEQGGFEKLPAGSTEDLNYIRVKGSGITKLFNPIAAPFIANPVFNIHMTIATIIIWPVRMNGRV